MLELLASVHTATTVSGGTATFGPCPQVSRKYKTENTNKMYAEYKQNVHRVPTDVWLLQLLMGQPVSVCPVC